MFSYLTVKNVCQRSQDVLSVRTYTFLTQKWRLCYLVTMKVGRKTHDLIVCKERNITCISYLKIKREHELVYLQSQIVTRVSYLKLEKAFTLLRIGMHMLERRLATEEHKGRVAI